MFCMTGEHARKSESGRQEASFRRCMPGSATQLKIGARILPGFTLITSKRKQYICKNGNVGNVQSVCLRLPIDRNLKSLSEKSKQLIVDTLRW